MKHIVYPHQVLANDASTLTEQEAQTALLTNLDGKDFSTLTEQQTQTALLEQLDGSVSSYARDFFGNTVTSEIYNQVEVPFDDATYTDYINATSVNGGSATQANGQVTISTGTNADGRYALISKDAVKYRPNHEIGFGFTWKMPTPSISGVTMRIGATDDITTWSNGVFFRHENGVFSLVHNNNGSEEFSAIPSTWIDPCDGSANSAFKNMAGTPVALDITKDQLARIHCGLFGHAGFTIELLAPNQKWVTIYKHSNINTDTIPLFSNFDLSVGAEVKKVSAGAGVYNIASACYAGWTGSSYQRMNTPISDRTLTSITRSVIEGKTTGGGGGYVPVKVNPSGALTVEATVSSSALPTGASTLAEQQSQTTLLTSLDGKDFSTLTEQQTQTTLLTSLDGKDFATLTEQQAQTTLLTSLDGKDFSTLTEQQAQTTLLTSLDGKDFATETTLSALNAKVIQDQQPMAQSISVAIASDQTNVPTALISDGYSPDPSTTSAGNNPLLVDASNRLETHSTVLTDEGSFRDDFSGVTLGPDWTSNADAGTSIVVSNSIVTLSSGTTSGEKAYIERFGDYLPYTMRVYCKVSQRIANQSIIYGFVDDVTNIAKGAYIQFTGTNSSQINFISQSSADPTDIQTTTVNLPDNILTSEYNLYQIDISANSAILSINNKVLVTHVTHIPGPYDLLNLAAEVENTGTAASSTTLQIDYIYFTNYDRLQIDNDFNGEPIKTIGEINFNAVQTDLFGKLRVSQTDQTLSLFNANTSHPLYFNSSTVGTASATFVPAKTALQFSVGTGATDSIIYQTRRHFRYTPGKPYQLNISGNFGLPKANNTRRFGYFDDLNGGFFQIDSTGISVVSRTNSSGVAVDTKISQANWNIDKLDGTTPSKFNLQANLDKHILYIIEWLWHGAVGVRFGVAVNRTVIYVHQIDAFAASAVPFWRTPSLPMRLENFNSGVTASATDAFFVCFAYTKESLATTIVPYKFTASTGLTSKTVRLPTPVISIRPKLTFNGITNRVPILPSDINIQTTGNNVVYIQVYLNPTLTGAVWVSANANSATEYDLTATASTGGTLVFEGFVPAAGAQEIELKEYDDLVLLGLNIPGTTADILTIVCSAGLNTPAYAAIQWKEFQ